MQICRKTKAGIILRCVLSIGIALFSATWRPVSGAEPDPADLGAALDSLRAQSMLHPEASRKLDAKLRMLTALAIPLGNQIHPTETPVGANPSPANDTAEKWKNRAKREGLAQASEPGANLQTMQGIFQFEDIFGSPAITVVAESAYPVYFESLAERLGAKMSGASSPATETTMLVPVHSLLALASNETIIHLRTPLVHRPLNNQARTDMHTDTVRNTWGYRGQGALYAAIDTGIDWTHQDFKNADGTTRIRFIWDQTASSGTPPSGYSYGAEWSSAQINGGSCTETDNNTADWGHGTSTIGVGAGNGSSTGGTYGGQADEADIILVKSDLTDAHIEDGLAYIKAKAQALGLPVSVNMSFGGGWGPHDGGDDLSYWIDNSLGVSDSSQGIALTAAAGNDTGYWQHADGDICAMSNPSGSYSTDATNIYAYSYNWSGSGYAGQPMFMEFFLPASASVQLRAWIPTRYRPAGQNWSWTYFTTDWIDVNASNNGFYYLTRKLSGTRPYYDSFVGDPTTSSSSNFGVYLDFQKPMTDYHNSSLQYAYVAYDYATTSESSFGGDLYYDPGTGPMPIIIQFRQNAGTGSGAQVDGYIPSWTYGYFAQASENCTDRHLGGDDSEMINGPAAAHLVTAVGAHVTRTSWTDRSGTGQSTTESLGDIASYSSLGPLRGTLEGTSIVNDQKPNLTAPGEAIVTTLSGQMGAGWYGGSPQNTAIVQETPSDKHIAQEGTSFACAAAAGASAILLGASPNRTLAEIRQDLQLSARADAFTGTTPNNTWGYGKLTLDSAFQRFAELVYRGITATSLSPLHGGVGGTYTDAGAAAGAGLYFYEVDVTGNSLRITKNGNESPSQNWRRFVNEGSLR